VTEPEPGESWGAFAAWCAAGVGGCFGVLSLLTVGPFVLLVTLMLCGWLLWRQGFGAGMAGLLTGAAVPLLYLAWLNRDGPGAVCTRTTTSLTCGDQWSPWPFLVVAVGAAAAGLVLFLHLRRS
jgi:hypothetical protein